MVDNEIVNFSDITEQVLNGNFEHELPPTFTVKNQVPSDSSQGGSLLQPTKQAKKDDNKKNPKNIINREQCREFKMQEDKDWSMFKNKKTLKWRLEWKDTCKMCPRWHSRGDCLPDCNNAASHVLCPEILPEKKESYRKYLKRLRRDD